jgi:hypothetical protein
MKKSLTLTEMPQRIKLYSRTYQTLKEEYLKNKGVNKQKLQILHTD